MGWVGDDNDEISKDYSAHVGNDVRDACHTLRNDVALLLYFRNYNNDDDNNNVL